MKVTCVVCQLEVSMSLKEIHERGNYCQDCNAQCGKPSKQTLSALQERRRIKALDVYYQKLYGKTEKELLHEAAHLKIALERENRLRTIVTNESVVE